MKKSKDESEARNININNKKGKKGKKGKKKKGKKEQDDEEEQEEQEVQSDQVSQNENEAHVYKKNPNGTNISGDMIQQDSVIVNQVNPTVAKGKGKKGSKSIKFTINRRILVCPYCKKKITTDIQKEFNCGAAVCRSMCFLLLPITICAAIFTCSCTDCSGAGCNCCGGEDDSKEKGEPKEIPDKEFCNCCYDATHTCPECKNVLGNYDSFPCNSDRFKKLFSKIYGDKD